MPLLHEPIFPFLLGFLLAIFVVMTGLQRDTVAFTLRNFWGTRTLFNPTSAFDLLPNFLCNNHPASGKAVRLWKADLIANSITIPFLLSTGWHQTMAVTAMIQDPLIQQRHFSAIPVISDSEFQINLPSSASPYWSLMLTHPRTLRWLCIQPCSQSDSWDPSSSNPKPCSKRCTFLVLHFQIQIQLESCVPEANKVVQQLPFIVIFLPVQMTVEGFL